MSKKVWIPSNFKSTKKFHGISLRNLIEGGVAAYLLYRLIMITPFVAQIKLYATLFLCGGVLAIGIIGIRGESISQFLKAYIVFKHRKRTMSFRQPQRTENFKTDKDLKPQNKADIFVKTKTLKNFSKLPNFKEFFKKKNLKLQKGGK